MKLRKCLSLMLFAMLLAACAEPPDLSTLEASITQRVVRVPANLARTPFGQSIAAAVTRSPQLGWSSAALREAEAGLIAVGGANLPEVSAGLRPRAGSGFEVATFTSFSLLLYDGGASASRSAAARARVLGSVAERHDAASQAALSAIEAWSDVFTTRALLYESERTLHAFEATVDRIEVRVAAGAGARGEVLTARSRLANERAAVVALQAEVARAEAVFFEVFGQAPSSTLVLPPRAPRIGADALFSSPILYAAEADLLAAEAEYAVALAERAPTLAVTLSALTGAPTVAGLTSEQTVLPTNNRRARAAAAQARIDARRTDLVSTRRALQSRVQILAAEIDAAERRLGAARQASTSNRDNLAAARDQFEAGRQSLLDLLDAEREALASERQRIQAEYDGVLLSYATLAATGDILDLFGITLSADGTQTETQ